MNFVMHVAFDNTGRLQQDEYYFTYKKVTFKLVQNDPSKHADVLLTLIRSDDKKAEATAYTTASEFLSALSWQCRSEIIMRHGGGYGVPGTYTIHQARCAIFDLPRLTMAGKISLPKRSITPIPQISTVEQRIAMTLYRDAASTNHLYLSFLLYWQVLETKGTTASAWVDKCIRKHSVALHIEDYLKRLDLGKKSLGQYLQSDCRDAIAHIRRTPGKRSFQPDDSQDNRRIGTSTAVVRELAHFYIRNHLKVDSLMFPVRATKDEIPEYLPENEAKSHPGTIAY